MSFKRLSLAVDLDSTVCDLLTEWLSLYNSEYDTNLQVGDLEHWDMALNVPIGSDVKRYLDDPGLYKRLEPYPGAVAALKRLHDDGHEIDIVTSPSPHEQTAADKIWWCRQHLPFIPEAHVNLVHKKHRFTCDVLIDDAPKHIKRFAKEQPGALRIAVAFPYNADVADLLHLRAASFEDTEAAWNDIERYIRAYASSSR